MNARHAHHSVRNRIRILFSLARRGTLMNSANVSPGSPPSLTDATRARVTCIFFLFSPSLFFSFFIIHSMRERSAESTPSRENRIIAAVIVLIRHSVPLCAALRRYRLLNWRLLNFKSGKSAKQHGRALAHSLSAFPFPASCTLSRRRQALRLESASELSRSRPIRAISDQTTGRKLAARAPMIRLIRHLT